MLKRFNVKNVYSFAARADGQSEEFSMIAGRVRGKKEHIYNDGKLKLLKFAAIYGANASGKSNLVKAMDLMKSIVLGGLPDGHTEKYCKVDPENKNKPSYFEIEIMLGQKYYAYGFEVILSQSRFISEWLVELNADNTEKELFTRNIEEGSYKFGGDLNKKGLKERLEVYADDISDNDSVLFLTIMNQNKKNVYSKYKTAMALNNVYMWIRDSFAIIYPDQPLSMYEYLSKTEQTDEICKLISAFGTGITDFEIVNVDIEQILSRLMPPIQKEVIRRIEEQQAILRQSKHLRSFNLAMRSRDNFFIITLSSDDSIECRTIEFTHGKKGALFALNEESDGTVRILDLLEILIAGEGKTYVIDELDRCLHPMLSYKFVDTFFRMAENKNIQLIVTTHESRLMDFDLLRRDEIWFVDKKESGESDIYSLEEYNARFDQKIDKAYMDGRYGGVPIFSTIFPVVEGNS
ncbi:MAG: ATP/GTP-binding protein [Lachnospiraceae bacterium]|nr:ATP/GTP-binding protein [Lachnospiraceae bacterium]